MLMLLQSVWRFIVGLGVPLDQLLSLVILFVWYFVASIATADPFGALIGCSILLLPLAFIWFSDVLSEFSGTVNLQQVNGDSPPIILRVLGWIGFLGLMGFQGWHIFMVKGG